jgi:small subunit ribosomal protein S16
MVKIRLRRVGAKKQPHYRVVIADANAPREGRFIEVIGTYNPRTDPPEMKIDAERAVYWLGVGAQPTEAVQRMLDKLGIVAHAPAAKEPEARPEVTIPEPEPVTEGEELPPAGDEELEEEFEEFELNEGEEEDVDEVEVEDEDLESEDEE